MYPTELYKGDHYRVTHSKEEMESLIKDGWSLEKPSGSEYLPYTANASTPEPPKRGPGRPPADRTA